MLDLVIEPPSSTLGNPPQDWNDIFIDDAQNIVIEIPPETEIESTIKETSSPDNNNQHDNNSHDFMDWNSQPQNIASYYNIANSLHNTWDTYDYYESNSRGTTLERLQSYSASNSLNHRMMVVRELLPTLKDINIEDAIQYVLPIFHKVSADRDEAVREMLANDIDQIILHFFTYAPPSISKHTTSTIINNTIDGMTDQSLSPNNQNTSSSSTSTNGSSLSTIDLEAAAPVATIPSQVFSFALIELLLDQKTVISSLALQSTISIASSILASAENDDEDNDEDEDAGDHHQQYCISLLDQEIVQGIILELYNIIKGKRKRHSKLYRFVPISSQQNNDDDGDGSIQSIDLGEIHLSKVACLSLISALVQYVGPLRCEKTCLPIIEDLSNDALFYVRREAAIALGSIAHYIHPSTIIERLVPLYYLFARDATSHVRNATILTLPILCELLPYEEKSRLAVDSVALFMKDADYNVRFTLAEIIGEVIAKFLPDDWEITGQPGNVPEPIIKFFLSLGDNSSHQPTQESIENQCSLLCAYNFPAVVLTAGASYWDTHFKEKYMKLAKDHQIKVRSSFAHSLHVIARIIGPNRTERDLIHIFALYVLDVDEIKRGILEHLADFLSILGVEKRLEYLPVLTEIWESVVTNRTLRGILVSQLASIVPLTTTLDQILDHILPLVISGCQDEIASIRETSTQVFSIIVQHFKHCASNFETWMTHLTKELTTFTLPSSNYRQRQVFSNACYNMLTNGLPYEEFIKYLLPKILPLANDPVTNVRIAVSKCLGALYYKVLVLDQQLHYQDLYDTVKKLATDKDQDVRHFVEGMITTTKPSPIIPQQQQQQQQIGDLLSELPSPPTSPVK